MSNLTPTADTDLFSEPYIKSLQNRAFNPLNDVTQTDFILEGGVTIALRQANGAIIVKIAQYPHQTSIVVPNAKDRLVNQNGEATIREIFASLILAHRSRRARLAIAGDAPEGLTDLLLDCLQVCFSQVQQPPRGRLSIYTPTAIQKSGFAVSNCTETKSKVDEIHSALEPLLTQLPSSNAQLVDVVGHIAAHQWARGHDIALVPTFYERTVGPIPGIINRLEVIRHVISEIPKFGVDPLPIVKILGG
jgi:hypothetical protein